MTKRATGEAAKTPGKGAGKTVGDAPDGLGLDARGQGDVAFVEALAQLLKAHDLAELEVTREYGDDDELHVRLSRYGAAPMTAAGPLALPPQAPAQLAPPAAPALASGAEPAPTEEAGHAGAVTSPMVGTVYLAPEPGAGAFIAVGDRVEEGQTLLIIEAMKTMNQIPSTRSGVVSKILVENAQPVEFGAPLVIIE